MVRRESVDGVPEETVDEIREQVLNAEREKLDHTIPRNINNEIKDIIEQNITKDYISEE